MIFFFTGSTADAWDKIRESSALMLRMLPSPLPGYTTPEDLLCLLRHACDLTFQPRLPLADAGARLLLLVLQQYVLKLGWKVSPGVVVVRQSSTAEVAGVLPPQQAQQVITLPMENEDDNFDNKAEGHIAGVVLQYLDSMLDMLEHAVQAAQHDMYTACRSSLAHGPLLAIRYIVAHIPWGLYCKLDINTAQHAAGLISRLIFLTTATADLVIPVLSTPEESNVGAEDVDADDIELMAGGEDGEESLAPRSQVSTKYLYNIQIDKK